MTMKRAMIIAALAIATIALMGTARAETPNERCITIAAVNVTTLPADADKMWHQASSPRLDHTLHSVIWFKLDKGVSIGVYANYIDKAGVAWAWGSAENDNAIVSGWVKHSSLKCN